MKNTRSDLDWADSTNLEYIESLSTQEIQTLAQQPAQATDHAQVEQKFINYGKSNFEHNLSDETTQSYKAEQLKVLQLLNAYRFNGHLFANLDPLERPKEQSISALNLSDYGLTKDSLDMEFDTGSFHGLGHVSLRKIISAAEDTYCGTLGMEYMHIQNTVEKRWIQNRIEPFDSKPEITAKEKKWLLQRLIASEVFEKFLHNKYVGQKRFSLEGGETLIPLLNALIEHAGSCHQVKRVDLGMAHRGRLNVLINILGKYASKLFKEFAGDFDLSKNQTGDVKYHLGFSSVARTKGNNVDLSLSFNPSHLELVSPVVEGRSRYHQELLEESDRTKVLPVIIHGDASIAGQGVVTEILNMSQSTGYTTQGTLHIVINNQIGFTTSNQNDARSTLYCTDVMKSVDAPIFHVNAEDPEMAIFVVKLALDYRMQFRKDVVVDMVCYRRHGHNEADEPAVTQPMMYKKIRSMDTTYVNYAKKLIKEKTITQQEVDKLVKDYRQSLKDGEMIAYNVIKSEDQKHLDNRWDKYFLTTWNIDYDTSLPAKKIVELDKKLQKLPPDFKPHSIVAKTMADRAKMAKGELNADWGFAEIMAYASLADIGTKIRLSGQDCGRGTFFHRHAIFHNQLRLESYTPLQHLHKKQGAVHVIDSVLSEEAVLGFEYGYATVNPESLVIWEAQFGDFANGAQAVIDQFITSAEVKWARLSNLVMMLPHGLEGQGPEHSSARIERFLQSCARYNIQVCVPSSASQIFHLLRRQIIRKYRKPLIIFTPKSLLRNKLASSPLYKFTDENKFKIVIGELYKNIKAKDVTRVVLCSGKVFYDLLERRQKDKINNVAILRIEQLYPFSHNSLKVELKKFTNAKQVIWCQEEPINQGVWYTNRHNFIKCINKQELLVVARELSAASAEGSLGLHRIKQNIVIEKALGIQPIDKK